jgi:hypothetical protein
MKMITECDVCQLVKKEVNNWWKVWVDGSGMFCSAPAEAMTHAPNDGIKDICGKQHAIEMYSRYLETGQLDKPVFQPPPDE